MKSHGNVSELEQIRMGQTLICQRQLSFKQKQLNET